MSGCNLLVVRRFRLDRYLDFKITVFVNFQVTGWLLRNHEVNRLLRLARGLEEELLVALHRLEPGLQVDRVILPDGS